MPEQRVAHCLWTPANRPGSNGDILVLKRGQEARFAGLQTCGSVWACPVCSAKISEVRRQELHQLLDWAAGRGHTVLLMTLTARHRRTTNLKALLEGMGKAKRRLRQSRSWRAFKDRIVGTVTALEVTYGENGWHPHYHEIMILEGKIEGAPELVDQALRGEWLHCLGKEGLSGAGAAFDVRDGSYASEYVSKFGNDDGAPDAAQKTWGAPEEMTLSKSKMGRRGGRTPMQLLVDSQSGDEEAGKLWQIYARTFKGKRQLTWSDGLKDMAEIGEKEDQEIAEGEEYTEDKDEEVARIPKATWYRVRHLRAEILEAAEAGGTLAVMALLERPPPLTCDDCGNEMVLIEDDDPPWRPRPGGLAAAVMDTI